ncbi:MAG: DnaB-like helicase N-terminal domain-containing protein, partial [Spirochaetota bacterium]
IREYFKESKKSNNYNNKNKIRKELYNKNEQNIKEPLSHKFQRIILSSLVANEKEAEYYIPKLNENMFTNSFYRKVFSLFKELIAQEGELTIDYVQEQLTDEENNKFKSIIDSKDEYKLDSENLKKTLSQTINNLKLLYIENRIKKNQINIKEAEKSGNLILLKEYMEEAQYLLYERKKFYDIKFNIDKE